MLFPISDVEINPIVPFTVAFFISFFTSMGGVSGAFLLLPFQVSVLGYTAPSVSATNQVFNIVAIPGGVYRYIKEGRMLWPLVSSIIIGTLPGVFIGAWIRIEYLSDLKNFKFFVGFILLYIGWRLLLDIVRNRDKNNEAPAAAGSNCSDTARVIKSSLQKVNFEYKNQIFQFSPLTVCLLCFFAGIAGGTYGIGGGAIVAPLFVAVIGLPVYAVAGPALMGTFVTSVAGAIFYHILAHFYPAISVAPDWLLGSLFGVGGFLGMSLGAGTQKYIPAGIIKGILCVCILFIAGKYIFDFL